MMRALLQRAAQAISFPTAAGVACIGGAGGGGGFRLLFFLAAEQAEAAVAGGGGVDLWRGGGRTLNPSVGRLATGNQLIIRSGASSRGAHGAPRARFHHLDIRARRREEEEGAAAAVATLRLLIVALGHPSFLHGPLWPSGFP